MRTIFLFPLSALVAVAAGCGSQGRESAARSAPQRDLTLATQTAHVEIASPVELRQPRRATRLEPAPRPSPRPKVALAAVATPLAGLGAGSAPVAAEPVAQPAATAALPNDRELLPGKTVTLIPASNGPSAGPDETDQLPEVRGRTMVGRGGGTCRGRGRGRGRGPGIGIATGPRPDFR